MNAATLLSFVGLLALVSMSDAIFGNNPGRNLKGNYLLTNVHAAKTVAGVFKAVTQSLRKKNHEVAFVSDSDIKRMIGTYRSQIPKISEDVVDPIYHVHQKTMVLSSVAVPIINFPVSDMGLRKSPTSANVIELTFSIPEITVEFNGQISQTNGKQVRTVRSRYAFQQIEVKMEVTFYSKKKLEAVGSAKINRFEPQSVIVGKAEGKLPYAFESHPKGSKEFKEIIAVAKHYIPNHFEDGPIVKDYAQKLFW